MEIDVDENDYVNVPEKRRGRKRTKLTPRSGGKLYRLGLLTLGLICILHATLKISLSLILYNDLTASNINVTAERDQLKKDIGRLNERIRMLEERPCPQGWRKFGSSCYYTSTQINNLEDSRQDCLNRGADLVVINSREEQIIINGLYESGSLVWIGLSDRDAEGIWTWVDGTPLTTEYWGSGQPDDKGGDQDCVGFIHLGSDKLGGWYDHNCSIKFRWICEK